MKRLSWESGWKIARNMEAKGNVNAILEKVNKLENDADTKEKVRELINVYESVLNIEPANRTVLTGLSRNCFLMAYGYGQYTDEKIRYLVKSIQYSEQQLYLNRNFRAKVDNGSKTWEAMDVLTVDDMYGLVWWYLSASCYWKECLNAMERVINIIWVKRANKILTRMMEIDPTFYYGTPYYLWANYYSGAPSFAGGDLQKADALFKKAIEIGPMMLNFRRTRARVLYTKTGNREAFIRDMEWVLTQDPHKSSLGYPLGIFIQRDAKDGLAAIDQYFKKIT